MTTTRKPTKLYGYPSFKYGDWRVIRKIPTYWGEEFTMITYKNKFAYLVVEGTLYLAGIYVKRRPDSKIFDYDISFSDYHSPKEVISLLQTHLPFKNRYWQISLRDSEGVYPQEVKVLLTCKV